MSELSPNSTGDGGESLSTARPTPFAATTESREQREERWIDWTQRAWQHCPLNLYDEHQKLGEIALGEMLTRIHELEAAASRTLRVLDTYGEGNFAECDDLREALNG